MRRPRGAWVPDGRAKHLREACEASRQALGVEKIDLYQLHVVDPKTPVETSARALARLREDGLVRDIGLCNVTVSQIEAACAIAPIVSVQVSLSAFDDESLRNGVAEFCRDNGIELIAHRPLGGDKRKSLAKNRELTAIASKHGRSPEEIVLAWLAGLGTVPIPGATRIETARSIASALAVKLDESDLDALDAKFSGRLLRVPRFKRRPHSPRGDVVLVMGMPGAGKSTFAGSLEQSGYERLNRDALGGSLSDLVPRLDSILSGGRDRVVLDNTYPTRASRNQVIETAWKHGAAVRCVWLDTSVADAQINSIRRMIELHGSLPTPEEIKARGKTDPRFLLPDAQFRYERTVEPPSMDEGLVAVDRIEFRRSPATGAHRAIVLDAADCSRLDSGSLRKHLDRYRSEGWLIFVHAWRPDRPLPDIGPADSATCPHEAGPPVCWCRKPIPGSVIEFAMNRDVDLQRSIVITSSAADRTMAERIGAAQLASAEFFA